MSHRDSDDVACGSDYYRMMSGDTRNNPVRKHKRVFRCELLTINELKYILSGLQPDAETLEGCSEDEQKMIAAVFVKLHALTEGSPNPADYGKDCDV